MLLFSAMCSSLPTTENEGLMADPELPVLFGTVVTVTCPVGHQISGDTILTCGDTGDFQPNEAPACAISEYGFEDRLNVNNL